MFWYLRVLFFYLVIVFLSIFIFIAGCILKILKVDYDTKYSLAKFYSEIFIKTLWRLCGLKFEVNGLEKLPKDPSVVLSNHQSFWDNIIMQIIIPKHSWIIKEELLSIPFWGWGLSFLEPIAVNRGYYHSVNQILKCGQKKLRSGLWIIIFPESTRVLPHETKKFKPSAVKLALLAKVPMVLMAHNAGLFWPKGFWIKKPGTIKIEIITTILPKEVQDKDTRSVNELVEQIINTEKEKLLLNMVD